MIQAIGGENGWYSSPVLWAIRGWMTSSSAVWASPAAAAAAVG